jgi:hypothetical protein
LGGAAGGESAQVMTLDSMTLPSLRLLKIDVEGMEIEALSGARQQIARHRPFIYVENDRREQSPALISLLDELGYESWWHLPPLFNPENFNGHSENVFPGLLSINLLCVPRESPVTIRGFRKVTGPEDWWQDPPPS